MIVGTIQMQAIPRTSYYAIDLLHFPQTGSHGSGIQSGQPGAGFISARLSSPLYFIPGMESKLKQADASENALTLLACLLESGTDANPGVLRHFIGKDICTKANLLLNQSGISCPPVDENCLLLYLNYFERMDVYKIRKSEYHRFIIVTMFSGKLFPGTDIANSHTNKTLMDAGSHYAIDENCLSSKLFFGHVSALEGKCGSYRKLRKRRRDVLPVLKQAD